MPTFHIAVLPTPVGDLTLAVNNQGALSAALFADEQSLSTLLGPDATISPDTGPAAGAVSELTDYFAGKRQAFTLPLAPTVGTPFQHRVWQALMRIPFGNTWSYARLAAETGSVARAVGSANGANPICIVVPCHRVIGADGSLTGYAGGLDRKRWLLRHEGALLA
jgi:methylated-DNA-[protein]-cysteine S-methyltransferase